MNVVVDYNWLDSFESIKNILDKAQENGLKYFLWETGLLYQSGYFIPKKYKSSRAFLTDYIENVVNKYKDHPALFGWYPIDEFSNDGDTKNHVFIREFYEKVKNSDPDHPTIITTQAFHQNPEFDLIEKVIGDVNDIVSIYKYLNSNVTKNLLQQAYYLTLFRNFNLTYASKPKPLIFVAQGPERNMKPNFFNYGDYVPSHNDNIIDGKLIVPQAYNAITQGANGILYFTRGCNPDNIKHKISERNSYRDVWENGFNKLGKELFGSRGIAKILTHPGVEKFGVAQISKGRKHFKNAKSEFVNFLHKKIIDGPYEGNYVFVVNLDSEEKAIKISLPEVTSSKVIQKWFENENIKPNRGDFSDIIDPYGRRVYFFE
jgi:hypothetical protein